MTCRFSYMGIGCISTVPAPGRQLEQRRQRWRVQFEPQQSAFELELEHRGPLRFTPATHIMCGDTTSDRRVTIYGL
nr:MAG TPA: hypothetical protein [Caudoviricetes sp.]DAL19794.1 MAG TPA_asm: hypothetical protein [Caudoviricetes sp.]